MKRFNDFIDKLFNSRFYHIICFLCISIFFSISLYDYSILDSSEELCFLLAMPSAFYLEYLVLTYLVKVIKRS